MNVREQEIREGQEWAEQVALEYASRTQIPGWEEEGEEGELTQRVAFSLAASRALLDCVVPWASLEGFTGFEQRLESLLTLTLAQRLRRGIIGGKDASRLVEAVACPPSRSGWRGGRV